jgi:hypothetical protein
MPVWNLALQGAIKFHVACKFFSFVLKFLILGLCVSDKHMADKQPMRTRASSRSTLVNSAPAQLLPSPPQPYASCHTRTERGLSTLTSYCLQNQATTIASR